ncbi:MAG TPA: pyruvate dehydrogenase (acetyl-transferring) E1 component subunit alpha [Thermoplasmata archaeon]|nr:pyruvate dehydrogenase (acetyl-transferring) E1 component subunit alpha [Thermoplasmata archaeon]
MVEEEMFRIVKADGSFDAALDPRLPEKDLLSLYRGMLLVRTLDNRMLSLQRQGRIGFYVPSTGQEACQIGAMYPLKKEDWVFPAYREPGAGLWRGFPLPLLVHSFFGDAEDLSKGRQMPNHYGNKDVNLVSVSSPVGTQISLSVGAAWAAKIRGDKIVALTFFGDGATSEGDFHAGMNFAGVFKTPSIFFCQNNQWAISVPVSAQTASKTLAIKAHAYGFEGVRVDGNDVLAVIEVTSQAVEKARAGGGPTLIEAVTYRMGPHSSSDDPTRYRPAAQVEEWRRKDPITRFKAYLEKRDLWDEIDDGHLQKELDDLVTDAIRVAEKTPPPALETVFTDVYAEIPPHLREQMEEFMKSGERRRPEISDKFPL